MVTPASTFSPWPSLDAPYLWIRLGLGVPVQLSVERVEVGGMALPAGTPGRYTRAEGARLHLAAEGQRPPNLYTDLPGGKVAAFWSSFTGKTHSPPLSVEIRRNPSPGQPLYSFRINTPGPSPRAV